MPYHAKDRKVSQTIIISFLAILSITCLVPLIHVLAVSLSRGSAATAGAVNFWPVGFNTQAYIYIFHKQQFFSSLMVSFKRVLLGTLVNLTLTILIAYPLSKESKDFKHRTLFAWFFVFSILFSGGLIPWYMTIKWTGLLNSLWALILPGAVPVFNVILLLNFFRGLPKELSESAFMDGANHLTTLWRIIVPISMAALSTVTLFTIVGHWNSWFDGLILMNSPDKYPLASYMQNVIISGNLVQLYSADVNVLKSLSEENAKAAQIFLGALPILIIYPFLQKYFVKGIVVGSIKE